MSGWPTSTGETVVGTENDPVLDTPAVRQSLPAPTETLTEYAPSPSNWTSDPTSTMSPALPFLPTHDGGSLYGCVSVPSGTPVTVSAACWKPPASSL